MRHKIKTFTNPIQLCGYFLPKGVGVGVVGAMHERECEWVSRGPDAPQAVSGRTRDCVLIVMLQMAQQPSILVHRGRGCGVSHLSQSPGSRMCLFILIGITWS